MIDVTVEELVARAARRYGVDVDDVTSERRGSHAASRAREQVAHVLDAAGWSPTQIGWILGVTDQAVKFMLDRADRQLDVRAETVEAYRRRCVCRGDGTVDTRRRMKVAVPASSWTKLTRVANSWGCTPQEVLGVLLDRIEESAA